MRLSCEKLLPTTCTYIKPKWPAIPVLTSSNQFYPVSTFLYYTWESTTSDHLNSPVQRCSPAINAEIKPRLLYRPNPDRTFCQDLKIEQINKQTSMAYFHDNTDILRQSQHCQGIAGKLPEVRFNTYTLNVLQYLYYRLVQYAVRIAEIRDIAEIFQPCLSNVN